MWIIILIYFVLIIISGLITKGRNYKNTHITFNSKEEKYFNDYGFTDFSKHDK